MDPYIRIDSFGVSLVALGLGLLLIVHGWLTKAGARAIASRVFGVLYGAWVVSMTLLPFVPGPFRQSIGLDPAWTDSVNIVPFRTIRLYIGSDLGRVAWENLLGNALLLLPLGALGPLAWRKLDGWGRIVGAGLAVSLTIEVLQFVKRFFDVLGTMRSFDVDDIMLNTLGVVIGYGGLRLGRAAKRLILRTRKRRAVA